MYQSTRFEDLHALGWRVGPPVDFVGGPPLLGWQGVVPKNAEDLLSNFSELIHDQLLDIEALFSEPRSHTRMTQ